jgi:glycerophosphoryl diester phosphodiesterase
MMMVMMMMMVMVMVMVIPSHARENCVIVTAHRGLNIGIPENSVASFEGAVRVGADRVELDVRPTRDNILINFHDDTLDRTTNCSGEVLQYDYEYIYNNCILDDEPSFNGTVQRVPTIADMAALAKRYSIGLYLDFKAGVLRDLLDTVYDVEDAWLHSYGSVAFMTQSRNLYPEFPIVGTSAGPAETNFYLNLFSPPPQAFQIPNSDDIDVDNINLIHTVGSEVWQNCLGERETEEAWLAAIEAGVDAIQTDRPEQLIAFLNQIC